MDFDALIRDEQDGLTRRLAYMLGGDRDAAEDVRQEALLRAWRSLPRDVDRTSQRAWLHRTASNLAIDELRRRARRPTAPLVDAAEVSVDATDSAEPMAEALAHLPTHDRFLLLLRFEAGFAHADIARLLEISEEAARKRVSRARAAFLSSFRSARAERQPLILLLSRHEESGPYVVWLERAGARVRRSSDVPSERDLALSDGLVMTGGFADVHSSLYGEAPRVLRGEPDLTADRIDAAVVSAAMTLKLPFVGICRGHQLLNIVRGGSLYQDVVRDGATHSSHDAGLHRVRTEPSSRLRSLVGGGAEVHSDHHQAISRIGHGLRVAAGSPDGLIEAVESTDDRFAVGLQWHPESDPDGDGRRVAEAMVDAAVRRVA